MRFKDITSDIRKICLTTSNKWLAEGELMLRSWTARWFYAYRSKSEEDQTSAAAACFSYDDSILRCNYVYNDSSFAVRPNKSLDWELHSQSLIGWMEWNGIDRWTSESNAELRLLSVGTMELEGLAASLISLIGRSRGHSWAISLSPLLRYGFWYPYPRSCLLIIGEQLEGDWSN